MFSTCAGRVHKKAENDELFITRQIGEVSLRTVDGRQSASGRTRPRLLLFDGGLYQCDSQEGRQDARFDRDSIGSHLAAQCGGVSIFVSNGVAKGEAEEVGYYGAEIKEAMRNDVEFEWIEPTQEHVGQMVEVRDHESKAWQPAKLTGMLDDEYKFAAKIDDFGSLSWKHARIRRQFTYAELQAKCGLKVGDWVKATRKWERTEKGFGSSCTDAMAVRIGAVQCIRQITSDGILFPESAFVWPYFVLEKVDFPQPKEKIRTVADLEVGEIIQIASNHWLQIMPFGNQLCSWQSNLSNDFDGGWVPDRTLKPGNRPAKELYYPDFSGEDIGKLAFYIKEPKDRFFIFGVFCDESSNRERCVILRSASTARQVTAPLSDVRVIS